MIKKRLSSIFISALLAAAVFTCALQGLYYYGLCSYEYTGNVRPSAVYQNFITSAVKHDYFTSPAGVCVAGSGETKKTFAADKNLGVIMYGADGRIEKTFKRGNSKYEYVFVSGNNIITLQDGKPAFFNPAGSTGSDQNNVTVTDPSGAASSPCAAIAVSGDIMYLANGGTVTKARLTASGSAVSIAVESTYNTGLTGITSLAAGGNKLILAADHVFESAVYSYDFINALRMKIFPSVSGLACYTGSDEKLYAAVASGNSVRLLDASSGAEITDFAPPSALSAGGIQSASHLSVSGSVLYVCDAFSRAVITLTLPSLEFGELLFASQGSEPGYLNRSEGVCEWDGNLYIADTGNNRIQVFYPDGSVNIFGNAGDVRLKSPSAVAVDPLGKVYTVDSLNRVCVYSAAPEFKFVASAALPGAAVSDIAASADGRIFIADAASGMILTADTGSGLVFSDYKAVNQPVSLSASINSAALFVLDSSGGVTKLEDAHGSVSAEPLNLPVTGITAIAQDYGNNILALVSDPLQEKIEIYRLGAAPNGDYSVSAVIPLEDPLTYDFKTYGFRRISFSAMSGSLYLADNIKSRIYTLDAADTGAQWLDPSAFPGASSYSDRTALTEYKTAALTLTVPLFSLPVASKASETIQRGTSVVVLSRDLPGNAYFSYVYLPSLNKAGYVMRSLLAAENADETPAFTDGSVFNDNTPVYKFPGRLSPRLLNPDGGDLLLDKGVKVTLLPYSKSADSGPERWYCIRLDGSGEIGFVNVLNVSNYLYQPTAGFLRTNADIKKNAADGGEVILFGLSGNEYHALNVPPLNDGARVQVVGTFRANSKYTEVIYQDPDLGLIQGYVLTKYIKYDTTTNFQLTMLILSIVLLAAVAAVAFIVIRKKNAVRR